MFVSTSTLKIKGHFERESYSRITKGKPSAEKSVTVPTLSKRGGEESEPNPNNKKI